MSEEQAAPDGVEFEDKLIPSDRYFVELERAHLTENGLLEDSIRGWWLAIMDRLAPKPPERLNPLQQVLNEMREVEDQRPLEIANLRVWADRVEAAWRALIEEQERAHGG
jgi:hypothetical protein